MRKPLAALLISLSLLVLSMPTFAAEADNTTPSGIPMREIESRIDELVEEHLHKSTPSFAVTVVKDGEIIFSKGYGYADIERQIPVDPSLTAFDFCSVSKVFVWISVMQLVEQGKLDLDADIGTYLPDDFNRQINFRKSFTMRDLMNHSAGFEDYLLDFAYDIDKIDNEITLREGLIAGRPLQIYEPGTVSSYSNFGTALAAYVAGHVGGQDYAVYERENIMEATGMAHTKSQPDWIKDYEFQQLRAVPYMPDGNGGFSEGFRFYAPMYPSGAMSGTAQDLALLAIALTPPADTSGPLFDRRETLDMMFTPSTLNPSVLSGTHHGLLRYDGVPLTIGHWGNNSAGGSANFVIAPSERFGVATLSNVGKVNDFITDAVIDLLFGNTIDKETPAAGNLPNASEVAGNYVPTSRFDGSLFEFVAYVDMIAKVTALDENTISISFGADTAIYRQTEPYVFRKVSSGDNFMLSIYTAAELHFLMEDGKPALIMSVGNPFNFSALPPGRGIPFLIGSAVIAAGSVLFFLITPIILLVRFLRKGKKEVPRYNLLCNGLLFGGTLLVLNNLLLMLRVLINPFFTSAIISPHIWMNYILLGLTVITLIMSLVYRQKSKERLGRTPFYIATIFFLALFTIVLWDWNFFAIV